MSDFSFDVGDADFDHKVLATSQQAPVIVDFWAPWCQPCRVLKPLLEKLVAEYGGQFRLAKINSDENPESARRWGVRGIPAVKAFAGGQLVDEFTGALPEGQVREFIERILPSPAEPLRLAAAAARKDGELETARQLLLDALPLAPKNGELMLDAAELHLDCGLLDDVAALLASAERLVRDRARLDALKARLQLAQAGGKADLSVLRASVAADPANLDAALQLANAEALAGDYRAALEGLLAIVQRDRKWQDEAARKAMLNLFTLLGGDATQADLLREFRVQLARLLN